MKRLLIAILMLSVMAIALIGRYRWDSGRNRGYEVGYWGAFNRVSNTLARLPGVTVIRSGYNADVTLEEFGFDIGTSDRKNLHVWFSEDDPIRRLADDGLAKALAERIRRQPE